MRVLVFEDEATADLSPITISRPAYAITCGSYRLIDWLRRLDLPIGGDVRSHLRRIQAADFADVQSAHDWALASGPLLAVNARAVPSRSNFLAIKKLIGRKSSGVLMDQECIAAMVLMPGDVTQSGFTEGEMVARQLAKIEGLVSIDAQVDLFHWPHDVIRQHMEQMNESLDDRIAQGGYTQREDGVFVADGASIGDFASVDTSSGPILLDRDVQVGPFCYLSGPVYAGPGTRVIEHAALKDGVSLGHTTKIGGEVEASVIESYTNKQHHGFLGHSYLGSWINLGAGTCNSDLKNTYGKINIEYDGNKIASEMQFLGCVVGDYSKSAINTGIFTGKVIGVCSMLYGFVTQNVPSFMNYAQIFGQVSEIPPEVMIATQARMFSRRKVTQRPCDMELIRAMYDLTAPSRLHSDKIEVY